MQQGKKSSAVFHQEIDPRFQGSKIGMSRGNVSRLPGSRLATVQGCSCPRCPRLQGSRFKVVGFRATSSWGKVSRLRGSGLARVQVAGFQDYKVAGFQGSKNTMFHRVPRFQVSRFQDDIWFQDFKLAFFLTPPPAQKIETHNRIVFWEILAFTLRIASAIS